MMIKRIKYLDEIKKVLGKQVVKVLLGMRRVGKSTLLRQIQDELLNQSVRKVTIALVISLKKSNPIPDYSILV